MSPGSPGIRHRYQTRLHQAMSDAKITGAVDVVAQSLKDSELNVRFLHIEGVCRVLRSDICKILRKQWLHYVEHLESSPI